jgi:hypothetical protein
MTYTVHFIHGGEMEVGFDATAEIDHPEVTVFDEIPEKYHRSETPTAGRLSYGNADMTDVDRDTIKIGTTDGHVDVDHVIDVISHEYMHYVLSKLIGVEANMKLDDIESWDKFLHRHTDLLGRDVDG